MKKVLIYLNESDLAPTGGANGYNFALKHGLMKRNQNEFEISYLQGKSVSSDLNSQIKKVKNARYKKILSAGKSIVKKGLMMYGPSHKAKTNLDLYDAVHFHRTMDFYWAKDSLKNYKGKVILTLHAPTMPSKQMFSMLTDFEKKYMKWFYAKLPEIDNYALDRADHIIIACPEAEEPYYNQWPGYAELHSRYEKKYLYMATGTEPKIANINKHDMREKYGIPQDAFVISYVGRHNEIKGYDNLKNIAQRILRENDNVYFLIAGTEGPLYHLEHERWIEVGWTKDPGSVINASDVFVLPNKETYFDLVLLEVLSLGQIVVASRTGGNKYFEKYATDAITLYDSVDEAVSKIESLLSLTEEDRDALRKKNYELYLKEFTNEAFAERYISSLQKIMN